MIGTMASSAQTSAEQVTAFNSATGVSIMPAALSSDHIAMPYIAQQNDDETEFSLYDKNFRRTSGFSVTSVVNKSITEKHEIRLAILEQREDYSRPFPGTEGMRFSLEGAKEVLLSLGYNESTYEIRKQDGNYLFVDATNKDFYIYDIFGRRYPMRYACLTSEGELRVTYETSYYPTGNFETERIPYGEPYGSTVRLSMLDTPVFVTDTGSEIRVAVTTAFFNADDAVEYIVPVYTPYTVVEEKQSDYAMYYYIKDTYMPTSLCVKSDNGTTVATINFAEYYYPGSIRLFEIGDIKYMSINYRESDSDMTAVYRIDKSTGSLQMACQPAKISVSPSVVDRSMPVTVTLGESNGKPMTLAVTGTDGVCHLRRQLAPGVSSAEIATGSLPSGMYVVTVSDGVTTTEHSKIIVR